MKNKSVYQITLKEFEQLQHVRNVDQLFLSLLESQRCLDMQLTAIQCESIMSMVAVLTDNMSQVIAACEDRVFILEEQEAGVL
ncbi:TPA: hypothetical protein ACPZRW_003592 [Yersinia enterocolitica]